MARQPRIDIPNTPYHVINRAVGRLQIFKTDKDYQRFIDILEEVKEKKHADSCTYNHAKPLAYSSVSSTCWRYAKVYALAYECTYPQSPHYHQHNRYHSNTDESNDESAKIAFRAAKVLLGESDKIVFSLFSFRFPFIQPYSAEIKDFLKTHVGPCKLRWDRMRERARRKEQW